MSDVANLPLGARRVDLFFAIVFLTFALTSGISDAVPTLGIEMTPDSANPLVRANYWYAIDADPLFMHPPVWMRFVTGLSTFVYGPFYLVLAWCLIKAGIGFSCGGYLRDDDQKASPGSSCSESSSSGSPSTGH